MNCKPILKYILLSLLLANLAIQSVEAYSYIKSDNKHLLNPISQRQPQIENHLILPEPQPEPQPEPEQNYYNGKKMICSSKILMVWNDPKNKTFGSHVLDIEAFNKLRILATTLTPNQFEAVNEKAKKVSTQEFLSLLNDPKFKEQLTVAKQVTGN
jgi:hypothetical protein